MIRQTCRSCSIGTDECKVACMKCPMGGRANEYSATSDQQAGIAFHVWLYFQLSPVYSSVFHPCKSDCPSEELSDTLDNVNGSSQSAASHAGGSKRGMSFRFGTLLDFASRGPCIWPFSGFIAFRWPCFRQPHVMRPQLAPLTSKLDSTRCDLT